MTPKSHVDIDSWLKQMADISAFESTFDSHLGSEEQTEKETGFPPGFDFSSIPSINPSQQIKATSQVVNGCEPVLFPAGTCLFPSQLLDQNLGGLPNDHLWMFQDLTFPEPLPKLFPASNN
jgi:hypothetical protein